MAVGLAGSLVAALAGAAVPVEPEVARRVARWEPVPLPAPGETPSALALDRDRGRLAVGLERGVLVGPPGGPLERVLRRGPVLDLAFRGNGALLVATGGGLLRVDPDGRSAPIHLGAGEAARAVTHLDVSDGLAAAATAGGVYASLDDGLWQRLAGLPSGEATRVALRPRGDGVEAWSVVAGELWITPLRRDGARLLSGPSRRLRTPFAPAEGGPVDLVFGAREAAVVVLLPRALLIREDDASPWQVLRPALPPGASARRLRFALGRAWLATDSGLLEAPGLAGPWQRAAPPAGRAEVRALVGDGAGLRVATRSALLRAVATAVRAGAPEGELPDDPDITAVHRAALAYLGLGRDHMRGLRGNARRRGWMPIVSLRVGHGRDSLRRSDYDEAFLSGETRHLNDREFDRGDDLDLTLTLSWDFGDLVYNPEEIDVSREGRAVIELRDDVLDEITQLYFERRRVLAALVAEPSGAEAGEQQRRAAELAAGLDAWTGGWFSAHAARP